MLVIPAIDLRGGRCVRLLQGRSDAETVYDTDPPAVARRFVEAGAQQLHLVDLDGAFQGQEGNLEAIRAIRKAVQLPLQMGGGLRTAEAIERMLELGIDSVIVGTLAVRNPEVLRALLPRLGQHLQLAVDTRVGKLAISGWVEDTGLDAVRFAQEWREAGISRAVFTNIARDGALSGPDLDAVAAFAQESGMCVTASGGVRDAADIQALATLEPLGVDRVIVGRALYEGTLPMEALA